MSLLYIHTLISTILISCMATQDQFIKKILQLFMHGSMFSFVHNYWVYVITYSIYDSKETFTTCRIASLSTDDCSNYIQSFFNDLLSISDPIVDDFFVNTISCFSYNTKSDRFGISGTNKMLFYSPR
jgi:hypothetical protein